MKIKEVRLFAPLNKLTIKVKINFHIKVILLTDVTQQL